jgi:hypothetical protein
VTVFVFLWGSKGWRLFNGFLRREIGGLRVILVEARSGVGLRTVCVSRCISSFIFFCGFLHRDGECDLSCLGLYLVHFFC